MKFGQALSVLESALPEEVTAPYREHLTALQDSAPPMPTATVRQQLTTHLGADWKERLVWLDRAALNGSAPYRELAERYEEAGDDKAACKKYLSDIDTLASKFDTDLKLLKARLDKGEGPAALNEFSDSHNQTDSKIKAITPPACAKDMHAKLVAASSDLKSAIDDAKAGKSKEEVQPKVERARSQFLSYAEDYKRVSAANQ